MEKAESMSRVSCWQTVYIAVFRFTDKPLSKIFAGMSVLWIFYIRHYRLVWLVPGPICFQAALMSSLWIVSLEN
jgi:hypothetical protein